jgi:hypothetical protein
MRPTFAELCDRSNQNLRHFLTTEVALGLTFVRSAKYQKGRGNLAHYKTSKRNALAALQAIDSFAARLPDDLQKDIATGRAELAQAISTI